MKLHKPVPVFESWPFHVPNFQKVEAKIKQFTEDFKNAPSQEDAYKAYKKLTAYTEKVFQDVFLIQVMFSVQSDNKTYSNAMNKLTQGMPLVDAALTNWKKALLQSKFRPYLEEKLGSFYFLMLETAAKSFDDCIIEEAQKEAQLSMQYEALLASIQVPFRGETYNLPQMSKFMQDLDRNTRKEASKAYYDALTQVRPQIEDIYDQLVHVRDASAKKMGYKNYIELGYLNMCRYDYNQDDVAAYRDEIATYVTPLVNKLAKQTFRRCGIKSPHVYDLSLTFPDGNPEPKGTTAEKVAAAQKMYDQMSEETSYYFKLMVDAHLLELDAKPGKQSGGYMTNFPKYDVAYIFSNFVGTSNDVDVLTHEFGHSFQYFMSSGVKNPEQRMPTAEACEIDSMSMEFFAEPYMDLFFDNPDKYRFEHLLSSISFLPYGATVDEFQHWVYANPDASKEDRNKKWHELELKYTPYKVEAYKDCEYMANGGRWLTQAHIFTGPFYYIDYTLAQIMAFEFFNLDRKNHSLAWKRYLKLCKMGGKYPFRTLVTKSGMKDPFVTGTIKKTIAPLIKQLKTYHI